MYCYTVYMFEKKCPGRAEPLHGWYFILECYLCSHHLNLYVLVYTNSFLPTVCSQVSSDIQSTDVSVEPTALLRGVEEPTEFCLTIITTILGVGYLLLTVLSCLFICLCVKLCHSSQKSHSKETKRTLPSDQMSDCGSTYTSTTV